MSEKQEIIEQLKANPKPLLIQAARKRLLNYSRYMMPTMEVESYHKVYYEILDLFAHGKIKKLMITMPPQHGKSEGSSRKIPSFMLGLNPDLKIAIASYESTTAQDFNKDVQRIIDSEEYKEIFPNTFLNGSKQTFYNVYARNTKVCEMVGHKGWLRAVGRGGALTSKSVDIFIMDDLYKDYEEGNSPVVREKAWKWYFSVAKSRLHNNSQELIVFTRWHEDDIIGRIQKLEQVIEIKSLSELENITEGAWIKINFEAIKTGEPTEIDPREKGQSLWENKHNLSGLLEKRNLDKIQFDCLYQGAPDSKEGMLYKDFKTYINTLDCGIVTGKGNYTDVADEGGDYLCSICYDVIRSNERDERNNFKKFILITDVTYTDEEIEKTTLYVPAMLDRNQTRYSNIESNAGGKAFAIIVRGRTRCKVDWFHQSKNKESRIMTNAALVTDHIVMPADWESRFPKFYEAVTKYKRMFEANKNDDAPDVLTGIIEKEILDSDSGRGIKRTN